MKSLSWILLIVCVIALSVLSGCQFSLIPKKAVKIPDGYMVQVAKRTRVLADFTNRETGKMERRWVDVPAGSWVGNLGSSSEVGTPQPPIVNPGTDL